MIGVVGCGEFEVVLFYGIVFCQTIEKNGLVVVFNRNFVISRNRDKYKSTFFIVYNIVLARRSVLRYIRRIRRHWVRVYFRNILHL